MKENVLALGPFIGSWEEEVLTFRPHMEWIKRSVPNSNVYVSSHANRSFLYEDNFIPINSFLTRTELKQDGYIHEDIDQSEYNKMIRQFKNEVSKETGVIKKNIDQYSLPYVKYNSPVSVYQKIFTRIPFNETEKRILFIPSATFNKSKTEKLQMSLKDKYDVKTIGDLHCHLPEKNSILTDRIDYVENGFKEIVDLISSSHAVITACSSWTALCNIQGVKVFSWGRRLGQYKSGGIYNFGNKKCMTMYHDRETKLENLFNQISYFLEEN